VTLGHYDGSAGPLETAALAQPEKPAKEPYLAAAVFLVSIVYLCPFRRSTTIETDEGIILQGAQRVMHRQVLYRDFFSCLTPGSVYLLTLILKVFGAQNR
jgi:hypothetical protein